MAGFSRNLRVARVVRADARTYRLPDPPTASAESIELSERELVELLDGTEIRDEQETP